MSTARIFLRAMCLVLPILVSMAGVAHGDDVVFLMDKSFSMGALDQRSQPRYERAIARAMEDIKFHLAVRDRVTVILFDSVIHHPQVLNSIGDAEIFFAGFNPGGDTNIIDALAFAFGRLRDSDHPLIYLYTDGDQTERATMDWEELVALYNGHNGGADPDRRIKLFHIKWRDSDRQSSTDDALRQIENITELTSRQRSWAKVEKVYFRPSQFQIEYDLDSETVDEPVAVQWFTVDMSDALRNRNLSFSVHAEVESDPVVDLIVSPSRFDCARDLDVDGSILLSFRCNGVSMLSPDRDYPIRVSFHLENETVRAETIRFSPPNREISGQLRVSRTPSFTIVEPDSGLLSIESHRVQEVEERRLRLAWNEAAVGKRVDIDYRFPIALQSELMQVTESGFEPLDPPNSFSLDESGEAEFILSLNRSILGNFEGELAFTGFGSSEVVRVEYALPIATVSVQPQNFETRLFVPEATTALISTPPGGATVDGSSGDNGTDSGDGLLEFSDADEPKPSSTPARIRPSISSTPIPLRFVAASETLELSPRFQLSAHLPDHPQVKVTVVPNTVVLNSELMEGEGFPVALEFEDWSGLPLGSSVAVSLNLEVDKGAHGAEAVRFDPASMPLRGGLEVQLAPSFTLARLGGLKIDYSDLTPGSEKREHLKLSWTESAIGEDLLLDVAAQDHVEVEIFEVRHDVPVPVRSGGIRLHGDRETELLLKVTALAPGNLSSEVSVSGFGKSETVALGGQVSLGHVDATVDRSIYSLRSVVGEWTNGESTILLSPGTPSACSQELRLAVESDEGVLIEVTDENGDLVHGKTIVLSDRVGGVSRFTLRAKNDYAQLTRRTDRPLNFVVVQPLVEGSLTFGEEETQGLKIPVGFAMMPPQIHLDRDGDVLEGVSVGLFGDSESIDGGWAVTLSASLSNVGADANGEVLEEFLQIETTAQGDHLPAQAYFVASGQPTATIGEFLADPRIGFEVPSQGFGFKLDEALASVSITSPVSEIRVLPKTFSLNYTRKGMMVAAAGSLLLLLGLVAFGVTRLRGRARLSGYLVLESSPVEVSVSNYDLSSLAMGSCDLGVSEEGEIEIGPKIERPLVRLQAGKTGVLVEAISDFEVELNEMPLEEESVLFDLSTLDVGEFRFRYQLELDSETSEEGADLKELDAVVSSSLGLVGPEEFDRDELVLEDDEDEEVHPSGFDEQVVLEEAGESEERRHPTNPESGEGVAVNENADVNLSETIVLEDEE